jgi:hypothetical protein
VAPSSVNKIDLVVLSFASKYPLIVTVIIILTISGETPIQIY